MKKWFDEYFKIIIYTICGLLLIMASYSIILNVRQMNYLSSKTVVSDIDTYYVDFKNNIQLVDNILDNYQENGDNSLYLAINRAITLLKNDGVFRLMPNSYITYKDLSLLNHYFMETLINNCWVSSLKQLNNDQDMEKIISILISNANFMHSKLVNTGISNIDSLNNSIIDDYQYILNNYDIFSYVVLTISQRLGGNYE